MNGWIWADSDYAWLAFTVLTILGALAAVATGRSFARAWSPQGLIFPAIILLAAAVQFLHYALFQEDLLSLHYYFVTLVILLAAAFFGYQSTRAKQMSTQYSWAFQKVGISWRPR
jgi:cell division protein FtsW (lipid II flippase)